MCFLFSRIVDAEMFAFVSDLRAASCKGIPIIYKTNSMENQCFDTPKQKCPTMQLWAVVCNSKSVYVLTSTFNLKQIDTFRRNKQMCVFFLNG